MSHHGNDDLSQLSPILKELRDHQRKLAGSFPDGKLSDQDEGALMLAVTTMGKRVVITFPAPTQWLGMTGDQAAEMGILLIQRAKEAGLSQPITITL